MPDDGVDGAANSRRFLQKPFHLISLSDSLLSIRDHHHRCGQDVLCLYRGDCFVYMDCRPIVVLFLVFVCHSPLSCQCSVQSGWEEMMFPSLAAWHGGEG